MPTVDIKWKARPPTVAEVTARTASGLPAVWWWRPGDAEPACAITLTIKGGVVVEVSDGREPIDPRGGQWAPALTPEEAIALQSFEAPPASRTSTAQTGSSTEGSGKEPPEAVDDLDQEFECALHEREPFLDAFSLRPRKMADQFEYVPESAPARFWLGWPLEPAFQRWKQSGSTPDELRPRAPEIKEILAQLEDKLKAAGREPEVRQLMRTRVELMDEYRRLDAEEPDHIDRWPAGLIAFAKQHNIYEALKVDHEAQPTKTDARMDEIERELNDISVKLKATPHKDIQVAIDAIHQHASVHGHLRDEDKKTIETALSSARNALQKCLKLLEAHECSAAGEGRHLRHEIDPMVASMIAETVIDRALDPIKSDTPGEDEIKQRRRMTAALLRVGIAPKDIAEFLSATGYPGTTEAQVTAMKQSMQNKGAKLPPGKKGPKGRK